MRARLISGFVVVSVMSTGLIVPAANAQDGACFRLWVARNTIYKANGYCFKTDRAIAYFGNDGCLYESESAMPLSRRDRERIARIQAQERDRGCR